MTGPAAWDKCRKDLCIAVDMLMVLFQYIYGHGILNETSLSTWDEILTNWHDAELIVSSPKR